MGKHRGGKRAITEDREAETCRKQKVNIVTCFGDYRQKSSSRKGKKKETKKR
jgi:hypothetical protein